MVEITLGAAGADIEASQLGRTTAKPFCTRQTVAPLYESVASAMANCACFCASVPRL
jgi:hypothetical protein